MKILETHAVALALAGALTVTAATPSFARDRTWVAAGAGFAAGALVGAAAANANTGVYYYGPAYAYEPGSNRIYMMPNYTYGYAFDDDPKKLTDPDPRIGGSFRLNKND